MADRKNDPLGFETTDANRILNVAADMANQQTAANRDFANEAVRARTTVDQSSERMQRAATESLGKIDLIQRKERREKELAGGGLLDQIRLVGEQVLDPEGFTQEGRAKSRAEISQRLGLESQIHNITAQSAAADIELAEAQRQARLVDSTSDYNVLQAQNAMLAAERQKRTELESVRATNLTTFDTAQVTSALNELTATGQDRIAIGGFDYTATELRERGTAIETREALSLLSPQASDPDYAAKLSVQQNLHLQTMKLPELKAIRSAGGLMPDGTSVNPALLDAHIERQQNFANQAAQEEINRFNIDNALPVQLEVATQRVARMESAAPAGSKTASSIQQYKGVLSLVSKKLKAGAQPQELLAYQKILSAQEEALAANVKDDALRRAGGDKELASIYEDQLLGQKTDPYKIQDIITSRLESNKGLGTILPGQDGVELNRKFKKLYQQKLNASSADFGGTSDKKELKAQAAPETLEEYYAEHQARAVGAIEKISYSQTDFPAVIAGLTPGQLNHMSTQAAMETRGIIGDELGLSSTQVSAIHTGHWQETDLTAGQVQQYKQQYNEAVNVVMVQMLERQHEGLAGKIAAYYTANGEKLIKAYLSSLEPTQADLIAPHVATAATDFANSMIYAESLGQQRGLTALIENTAKRRDPEFTVAAALENSSLDDSYKARVFNEVVKPAIDAARALNMTSDGIAAAVNDALRTADQSDPVMKSALGTFIRELPKEWSKIDKMGRAMIHNAMRQSAMQRNAQRQGALKENIESPTYVPGGRNNTGLIGPSQADSLGAIFPWMKQEQR